MSLIDELNVWKVDLEALSVEKGRAEGRLEQAREKLKELGFDSVEKAQEEVLRLEKEKADAEEGARTLLVDLKEKYASFIK